MRIVDASVAIIVNGLDEVLIQKKDMGYPWFPGKWCLFGGGIEKGEDSKNAIERELREELKVSFYDLKYLYKTRYLDTRADGQERGGDQHIYSCRFNGKLSDISLSEGAGFGFFSNNELLSVPIVEHDRLILERYYSKA